MTDALTGDIIVSATEFCDALDATADVTVIHRGRKPDIRIDSEHYTNRDLWELVANSRFTIRNIDWRNHVIQFRPARHPDTPARYLWYDHATETIISLPDGPLFDSLGTAIGAYAEATIEPTATHALTEFHITEHRAAVTFDEITADSATDSR